MERQYRTLYHASRGALCVKAWETRSHASRGTNKVEKPTASTGVEEFAEGVKKCDKPEMLVLKDEERGCLAAHMFQQKVATGALGCEHTG